MQISRYQVFIKVVEEQSITKAADALNYTQSGVSHIIKNLEKELGFTLIIRSSTSFHLTDEGRRVYEVVKRIAAEEENLLQVSSSIRGIQEGHIRLGTQCSVSSMWLPGMIKTFLQQYPKIEFELVDNDYETIESMLLDDLLDMAFIAAPKSKELDAELLMRDDYYAVVSAEHPWADRSRVSIKDFASENFIMPCEGLNYGVGELCQKYNMVPNTNISVRDDSGTLAMVRAGLGVTILSELLIPCYNTTDIVMIPVKERAYRRLCLVQHRGRELSPLAGLFRSHAVKWVDENVPPEKRTE